MVISSVQLRVRDDNHFITTVNLLYIQVVVLCCVIIILYLAHCRPLVSLSSFSIIAFADSILSSMYPDCILYPDY